MLEVHRWRQIQWGPSAVVALATSVDRTVVAAARENGAIELWNVAPGSVGWHCYLTIPGKEDAAISSLVWCKSSSGEVSRVGRLFSAGLDGFITEWDLQSLQPKEIVVSHGGSVWQLAAEPLVKPRVSRKIGNGKSHHRLRTGVADSSDNDENSEESDEDRLDEGDVLENVAEQRVAVGCDDGCVRLFIVGDNEEGMLYRRCFPRLRGRILSVAWSVDGSRIYSGGSDGSIHCWDSYKIQELFRITVGIGGISSGSELCVWSLLALRDGTIVSGDSTGSTQFWEGKHGTLLQAYTKHGADVLALAASPSHRGVFAAGADGQVILYQHLDESLRTADGAATESLNVTVGPLADKWVFVGSKRIHTHDVRALTVACPVVHEEGYTIEENVKTRVGRKNNKEKVSDQKKWVHTGTAMLISGGNDTKLFTYPANAFLAFHPHDICPAPERPYVQLACELGMSRVSVFITQHPNWIDVWRVHTKNFPALDVNSSMQHKDILRKRKVREETVDLSRKTLKSNGLLSSNKATRLADSNGKGTIETIHNQTELTELRGVAPGLVARIKCRTSEHICCSAISGNGKYVAFSDGVKPRLYQVEQGNAKVGSSKKQQVITKKKLPLNLPAAQSIQFTSDSTRLLLGCFDQIMVIDVENAKVVHAFPVVSPNTSHEISGSLSPMKFICTSVDSQWLAATTTSGHVHIFNLETLRHHWSIPMPGGVATSAIFRPSSSNVLIVSTSTNQIHVLDIEAKELSEWSKVNGGQMSRYLMEFPGGIMGLSVPPTSASTSVIAYSSRAMCQIDFSKPLVVDSGEVNVVRQDKMSGRSKDASQSSLKVNHHSNGNASDGHRLEGHSNVKSNFVVVLFKDPVLFLGHITQDSLLVIEKPWLEVLRQLPAPVFRHLYGT